MHKFTPHTHEDWTTSEIAILEKKYPEYSAKIPELLENHTRNGIYNMAAKIGIKYTGFCRSSSSGEKWEDWEYEVLENKYPFYGTKIDELRHRSRAAIDTKARWLGLKYDKDLHERI